jgi:prepilin-type processing-associated H-X9-DG protein
MPLNWLDDTETRNLPGSWVLGCVPASASARDFDLTNITAGTLYHYVKNPQTYRCPADRTKVSVGHGKQTPVIRSYSTLSALNSKGGYYNTTIVPSPWLKCDKFDLIQYPSAVWGFIEPSGPFHDIAGWDFIIAEAPNMTDWAGMPTDRHSSGCNLSFLDGRVQFRKWKAPKENRVIGGGHFGGTPIAPGGDREDFDWLFRGHPRN